MELHCIVRGTLEPPKYIVWYRGEQQVVPENEASGHENGWYTQIDRNIFGSTEHSRNTVGTLKIIIFFSTQNLPQIGTLVIPVVRKTHSGNYTCEPENSQAVSLQLHVLSGEKTTSIMLIYYISLHIFNSSYYRRLFRLSNHVRGFIGTGLQHAASVAYLSARRTDQDMNNHLAWDIALDKSIDKLHTLRTFSILLLQLGHLPRIVSPV